VKVFNFSFKREAVWIWVFAAAPVIIGLLVMFVVLMFRK